MAKKMLEVNQLTTKYITRQGEDVYSVDHVTLDIEEGKSLGIAGESGCGKSTLALSLMGYYFPPLHYISGDKEDSLVLHNSLRSIAETFASQGMVRCHRGYLVNLANVKYLRKEKDGLVLEIAYCDRLIPVSKTYAQDVVQQFAN